MASSSSPSVASSPPPDRVTKLEPCDLSSRALFHAVVRRWLATHSIVNPISIAAIDDLSREIDALTLLQYNINMNAKSSQSRQKPPRIRTVSEAVAAGLVIVTGPRGGKYHIDHLGRRYYLRRDAPPPVPEHDTK